MVDKIFTCIQSDKLYIWNVNRFFRINKLLMQLTFDQYHLLCVDNPNIPQLKEYRFSLSDYQITSYDKGIFVYHKKQRKLIHLKNLGNGMQVCYLQEKSLPEYRLNISVVERTLAMFSWFNEETGEKYCFLPFYSRDVVKLQQYLLTNFGISCQITKEKQGTFVRGLKEVWSVPESDEELFSHLFALVILYWTFEIKNNELLSAKSHIPLFSTWNIMSELFIKEYLPRLQELGIFISSSTVQNWDRTILQLTMNDWELLECFAKWLNLYQKTELILQGTSLQKKQHEIRDQLLDFITSNPELKVSGQEECLELIRKNRIKLLKLG